MKLPAFVGKERQLPWPCSSMYDKSFWSSSGVHGPFFKPTFSQHGDLPIGNVLMKNYIVNFVYGWEVGGETWKRKRKKGEYISWSSSYVQEINEMGREEFVSGIKGIRN